MANPPNLHIFELWEETGASGGISRRHRKNVQTPHSHPKPESNMGPWRCEAAVLTTVPPCCPGRKNTLHKTATRTHTDVYRRVHTPTCTDTGKLETFWRLFESTEGEFSMANSPNQYVSQNVGGNWSTWRKPTQIRGECANSTQTVTQPGIEPRSLAM